MIKIINEDCLLKMIDSNVYAYISGFFDGEGCVGTHIDKRNSPHTINLRIHIANTNYEVLVKIKNVFGGKIYPHHQHLKNRKDAWDWYIIDRNELKNFLEKILPYSTVKRQQIKYGLKYLELTSDARNGRSGISNEEQKIRQFISDKLKELKDIELSVSELDMIEEIKNINKDKNQLTMEDY